MAKDFSRPGGWRYLERVFRWAVRLVRISRRFVIPLVCFGLTAALNFLMFKLFGALAGCSLSDMLLFVVAVVFSHYMCTAVKWN